MRVVVNEINLNRCIDVNSEALISSECICCNIVINILQHSLSSYCNFFRSHSFG